MEVELGVAKGWDCGERGVMEGVEGERGPGKFRDGQQIQAEVSRKCSTILKLTTNLRSQATSHHLLTSKALELVQESRRLLKVEWKYRRHACNTSEVVAFRDYF